MREQCAVVIREECRQKLSRLRANMGLGEEGWKEGTRWSRLYVPKKNLYERNAKGGKVGKPGEKRKWNVAVEGRRGEALVFNSCYY